MRGLIPNIEDLELDAIFRELDIDNDGSISQKEFIRTFSTTNCSNVIKRIRKILKGAAMSAEYLYNKYCVRDQIKLDEFKQLVRQLIEDIADYELEFIF